jgi:hypothetical protein
MRVPIGENLRPLLALYAAPHLVGMVGPGNQPATPHSGFRQASFRRRDLECTRED